MNFKKSINSVSTVNPSPPERGQEVLKANSTKAYLPKPICSVLNTNYLILFTQ
jgi:hypothetical protein